eukprot:TRINITY_DN24115_c0_g1_i1.p1 TRINITY_DN24115_c0_g1~~TRINITY_DN24115_c0_g1_i1.p1  ORF type:complete len:101 (-),score=12.73 TRINITY_DN24115_c0_g1_i1:76-378(-)
MESKTETLHCNVDLQMWEVEEIQRLAALLKNSNKSCKIRREVKDNICKYLQRLMRGADEEIFANEMMSLPGTIVEPQLSEKEEEFIQSMMGLGEISSEDL